MEFFNKAKEAAEKYASSDSSKNLDDKKKSDSIFSKAIEAAEKYHAKEKVAEFAQKRVAKREEEKLKPGYEEKKDKSVVDKAMEAAEDFLAKQGGAPEDVKKDKKIKKDKVVEQSEPEDNNEHFRRHNKSPKAEDEVYGSFSKMNLNNDNASSYGGDNDSSYRSQPARDEGNYNAERYPSHESDHSRQNVEAYESAVGGGSNAGYPSYPENSSRNNNPSDGSRYETYQEYWSRQGNGDNQKNENYSGYPSGATGAGYGYGQTSGMGGGAYENRDAYGSSSQYGGNRGYGGYPNESV
ncbi:hypothetical protein PR003_g19509 [Phytophthora rubi]|uniref:Uncharacterized protein n=1 Tax=Phytophthora rubi TaxID=129364 RepID=A0A6A3JRN2_9STRA|nr:hypothetical protein PR002_g19020 [Phytophthora rubi]KAE9001394.1 hypothetical protein PR001_g18533 [Phytophthora rubi]KAE9313393.1 hypothetical protein PR003_g19509 [Phytophthora rubi]